MNTRCMLIGSVIALNGITSNATAQARPDPADRTLRSPTIEYTSPFAGYRRYQDEKPAPWRELNNQVLDLGGHGGHIKDGTSGTAKPAPQQSTPIAEPTSGAGHSSHQH
jgi:hypothetical protein